MFWLQQLRTSGFMKHLLTFTSVCGLLFFFAPNTQAQSRAEEPIQEKSSSSPTETSPLGFRYWHGDIALGLRAGGRTGTVDGQLYAGAFFARNIVVPGWSPFVGLGAHVSGGEITVEDPRGIEGKVDVARFAIGPELRFGLARGKKIDLFKRAWPDVQLYLTSALISVHAEKLSAELPEAGQAFHGKFGLGASFPALWSKLDPKDPVTLLVIILPNTYAFDVEVPWSEPERARYGIRFGYGF
jgi:hypothetical protein